jgi:hypothetical protein
MKGRRLHLAPPHDAQLELPTIMDRTLAAKYGASYVQLAAFAIDVDRLYALQAEWPTLPFAWEVFLTECALLSSIDAAQHALLEDVCLSILEQAPEEQGYGSQLLFAVYDAIARERYPKTLLGLFRSWKSRPKVLLNALSDMWRSPNEPLSRFAAHALAQPLDPPLSPPTRDALARMASGLTKF